MAEGDDRLERLRALVQGRAVLHGEFTLSSGAKSTYYFDVRRVTHDAEGITLVGELVLEAIQEADVLAIGGPSAGANPMITATQIAAHTRGIALAGFFVRSARKEHGAERLIEGNLPEAPGARVAIVDDTMTTGGSVQQAIKVAEAAGCTVAKVVVIVDRRQGGAERLRERGYAVAALLEAEGDRIKALRSP